MKKLILSLLTMASLAFAANAVTYLNVKTDDGKVVEYDVKNVVEVYYQETSSDQGVTVSGKVDSYTYVDLGLPSGTKWATYNVGATMPTEYGDYFAWGETKPKENYYSTTYKLGSGNYFTKYIIHYGYAANGYRIDNLTELEAKDDAATANWGSAWRMPTGVEQAELQNGCEWKWVKDFNGTGVNGMLGTSMANGNIIFLPAAGYRSVSSLLRVGSYGYYWSSSLNESRSDYANYLNFRDGDISRDDYDRYYGRSVRAVLR
ncbi:MAG: hypothetical protein MJZ42_05510 [Bacteroidales bacterium]|nr:hypothetical protein [Bacteroidales bacterium]